MENLPDLLKAILFTAIAGGIFFTVLVFAVYLAPMLATVFVIYIVYKIIQDSNRQ